MHKKDIVFFSLLFFLVNNLFCVFGKGNIVSATMEQHKKHLVRAKNICKLAPCEGGSSHDTIRVGACIVDEKGKELSFSANRVPKKLLYFLKQKKSNVRSATHFKNSDFISCAEQMAISNAFLINNTSIKNATLYSTLSPCLTCAGIIIECGITTVCIPKNSIKYFPKLKKKWRKSLEIGRMKLLLSGIKIIEIDVNLESL
jgi:deoxycytidylate deaminase